MPIHQRGAIHEPQDPARAGWQEVAFALPPANWDTPFDIEEALATKINQPGFKLPVNDQGESGSCGGQADEKLGEVLNAMLNGSYARLSAKFTYAQCFYPDGGGTTDSALASISTNDGWAPESLTASYQEGQPPTEAFMEQESDITLAAREAAIKVQALAPVYVGLDIDSIAQAIQNYCGVRIGLVGSNNGTWRSDNPQPPTTSDSIWSHFLYAGKTRMMNGVKQIAVLNSWGTDTGDSGWQWLDESYFGVELPQSYYGTSVWCVTTYAFNTNPKTTLHYNFENNISAAQTGEDVIALQTALQILGFFPIAIAPTGYYGPITTVAVLAFQKKNSIAQVGNVGPITRAKLNSIFFTSSTAVAQ